jgi:hypothetical protein
MIVSRAMRHCLLYLAALGSLAAAPLRQELGDGLVYVRAHQLPGDLPILSTGRIRSTILDVRFVAGDLAAGTALGDWLKRHASLKTPVVLLVNSGTGAAVLTGFGLADNIPGLVVIGPAGSNVASDIAVDLTHRPERQAYDALEAGIPVAKLIDENPEKPRNDEARLAKDHLTDAELAASSDSGPLHDSPPGPTRLIDAQLQRAVQFFHALTALKRL